MVISLLLVSECFFRDKNIVTVIRNEYASKWWVTWPFLHNDLKNVQLGHFIRNFIGISGLMIRWSQKQYFCNQFNKCFNLRYHSVGLSPLFLLRILTVRDWKMFCSYHVTYHSINKIDGQIGSALQRGVIWAIRRGLSLKTPRKNLQKRICTSWEFPDLPIAFYGCRWSAWIRFHPIKQKIRS